MLSHDPLALPASSYAALAPRLVNYLLQQNSALQNGSNGHNNNSSSAAADASRVHASSLGMSQSRLGGGSSSATVNREADTIAATALLAVCVRGSPHFRQYIRGLRQVHMTV